MERETVQTARMKLAVVSKITFHSFITVNCWFYNRFPSTATGHAVIVSSGVASARTSTVLSVGFDCQGPDVLCKGTTQCISPAQVCDGKLDCPDGFDELYCSELCQKRGDVHEGYYKTCTFRNVTVRK